MSRRVATQSCLAAVLAASGITSANVLFSDNFESYNLGALDKNISGGPNAAPNGSGQPWFGPAPPNLLVVNSVNAVNPISGVKMLQGRAPNDLDQEWVNLPYRFNAGEPFTGNIRFDFNLYDPLGQGGTDLRDYGAIGFYDTAPTGTDYPGTGSLNTGVGLIQRISLGASSNLADGYDSNFYQARIVGADDGYFAGWFNTPKQRSVGWHQMRIEIGPRLTDGTNEVRFFIDDLVNPVFTHNSVLDYGYNVIELNMNHGPITSYIDDVAFSVPTTGDVNLDGQLNPDDFALLDKGFSQGMTGYRNGDINVSGAIDSADYLLIDTAYLQQQGGAPSAEFLSRRAAQFGPEYVAQLVAAVPEPAAVMALQVGLVLCRRRRGTTAL